MKLKKISWDELLKWKNGFVNNDGIEFEIETKIDKPIGVDIALEFQKSVC